jgi:hypothetical protein
LQRDPPASGRSRQEVTGRAAVAQREVEARGSPTGGQSRGSRGRRRLSALDRYTKGGNVADEDEDVEEGEEGAHKDSEEEEGGILSGDEEEEERTGAVLSLEEVSYDRDVKVRIDGFLFRSKILSSIIVSCSRF